MSPWIKILKIADLKIRDTEKDCKINFKEKER